MSNLAQMNSHQNVVSGSFRKSFVARSIERFLAWNQRRLAIRELESMSDTFLKDIGIERYQIRDMVNQSGQFIELRSAPSTQIVKKAAVQPLRKAAA